MSARPELFVIASYMRDLSVRVAHFARPGETIVGSDCLTTDGGKGSNQAIQAARCGARVAIIGGIGEDDAGRAARARWAAEGIDATGVQVLAGQPTGMAMIVLDDSGENQIVIAPGANRALTLADVARQQPAIAAAHLVIAQLETPLAATVHAFELARAAGVTTLLNCAPAPGSLPPALWSVTDILVANELEAATLAGLPCDADLSLIGPRLLAHVATGVVITIGERGAWWWPKAGPALHRPAPAVTVVDTTGAGDAFVGAFATRWAATRDAAQALTQGVAAGSLACTRRGATAALPSHDEIGQLIARTLAQASAFPSAGNAQTEPTP